MGVRARSIEGCQDSRPYPVQEADVSSPRDEMLVSFVT